MLHEFVTAHREALIARTRARVAKRSSPPSTWKQLDVGIPTFLDQLVAVLRGEVSLEVLDAIGKTATTHGSYLLDQGLTVSQVVHDYGDVCQVVTELAQERRANHHRRVQHPQQVSR